MFNLNSKAMKTKTTFKNSLTTAVIALSLLFGFNVKAQTYVYDEVTSSGIFFDGNGAEVSNPVSDAVNSSENCANSGDAEYWQKIQYFPTYTPVAGDFLFISVYNPNGAGPGQIQFEYTGDPGNWQWGDNITYESESLSGWVEYSIDLTPHVGNQINKVIVMPAGGSEAEAYADNIYFGTVSVIPVPESPIVYNDEVASGIFFDGNGAEVSNPVSDAVNSSAICANSGDADVIGKKYNISLRIRQLLEIFFLSLYTTRMVQNQVRYNLSILVLRISGSGVTISHMNPNHLVDG